MEEIKKNSKIKLVASGIIPLLALGIMIFYILGPGSNFLGVGKVLPEISIERIEFHDSTIIAAIRNTGQINVEVAQADVNDRIQPAAIEPDRFLNRFEGAKVIIPFEWNEGQPYEIGITTSDGTRFSKSVIAVQTKEPTFDLISYFAIIGTYVGVIPVLIGLLWFPFISKMDKGKYKFFLTLTAGLLSFLGIDAIKEGFDIATKSMADSFNGPLLVATISVVSFIGLYWISMKLINRNFSSLTKPVAIALMIAIGIGLHNLGEGLAIGAAVGLGELALSTFLIVGFAIHNTTEGLAIAAPMTRAKPLIGKLFLMGIIAGVPAIFGTWIGGFVYSPISAVIFLSIGAGAIFQVIASIFSWIKQEDEKSLFTTPVVLGFSVGMLLMYFTSIFI